MSDLRKQLQAMQLEYRSAKYPGNLTAELLTPQRSRPVMRIVGWSALVSGLAAAVVLWVTLRPATTQSPLPAPPMVASTQQADETIVVAETTDQDVIEVQSIAEMGPTPAFPEDVSFAPSATELNIPSTFTFPSMDMDFSETVESSTEESA